MNTKKKKGKPARPSTLLVEAWIAHRTGWMKPIQRLPPLLAYYVLDDLCVGFVTRTVRCGSSLYYWERLLDSRGRRIQHSPGTPFCFFNARTVGKRVVKPKKPSGQKRKARVRR